MTHAVSVVTPLRSRAGASLSWLAALVLCVFANHLPAATFCVAAGDAAGLQSAISNASNNDEDNVIELQSGQYYLPQNFVLNYYPDTHQHDLKIAGGYTEFFGSCLPPSAPDARTTVIDGGIFYFHLPDGAGSIEFDSLTLSNMVSTNVQYAAPFSIASTLNSTGNVIINNSVFYNNISYTQTAVFIWVENGVLSIQNSLFVHNTSLAGYEPISFVVSNSGAGTCLEITNSTFSQNTSTNSAVSLESSCTSLIANSVFWGNSQGDLYIYYPSEAHLIYDDLQHPEDAVNTQVSSLLSVPPFFKPDFSLEDSSPLRDAGTWVYARGAFDVSGNPRFDGAAPDIGALEIQDVIFAHAFDW